MGQKSDVRLSDIAGELGVSIVSVSKALNGKKGVGEELRTEILRKANEMGYEIKEAGKEQEYPRYKIGVIIAERYMREFPSFYTEVYQQVTQTAASKGWLTVLEMVREEKVKEGGEFSLFGSLKVSGIIIIGEMAPEFVRQIRITRQVPVVCIGFYQFDKDVDYIVTDNFHGAQYITRRLVDAGHTDIVFAGVSTKVNNILDRYMGYCKALKCSGLDEAESIPFCNGNEVITLPDFLPSAFVCSCVESAHWLLDRLSERGLVVPDDVSVVGYDCAGLEAKMLKIESYESDKRALAQVGINILQERIEGTENFERVHFVYGSIITGNTVKVRKE